MQGRTIRLGGIRNPKAIRDVVWQLGEGEAVGSVIHPMDCAGWGGKKPVFAILEPG